MTKIIGHRGAAGLALENSRASLLAALRAGVDMIEFDTRLTADDKLVLMHDPVTERVASASISVRSKTLTELRSLGMTNGEPFLGLDEALDIVGDTPVIIELKDEHSVDELLLILERHPHTRASIASFHHDELRKIRRVLPNTPIFVLEHFAPVDIIHSAQNLHAAGIGLNKWLMNPLTYRMALHYHLELYVYTVNSPLIARFMRALYPGINLCTDRPERFIKTKRRSAARPTVPNHS